MVPDDGCRMGALFDRPMVLVSRHGLYVDFRHALGLAAFPLRQLDLSGGYGMVLAARQFLRLVPVAGHMVSGAWLGQLVTQNLLGRF